MTIKIQWTMLPYYSSCDPFKREITELMGLGIDDLSGMNTYLKEQGMLNDATMFLL